MLEVLQCGGAAGAALARHSRGLQPARCQCLTASPACWGFMVYVFVFRLHLRICSRWAAYCYFLWAGRLSRHGAPRWQRIVRSPDGLCPHTHHMQQLRALPFTQAASLAAPSQLPGTATLTQGVSVFCCARHQAFCWLACLPAST